MKEIKKKSLNKEFEASLGRKLEEKREIQGQLQSRKKNPPREREVPGRRIKDWEEASV